MSSDSGSRLPRDGGASEETGIRALRGWLKHLRRSRNGDTVRETLEELIEEREDEDVPIDATERHLLGNVLHLRDTTAMDVMVPRADIIALDQDMPQKDLIAAVIMHGHSRYPVYRETLDDVVGLIHIKDLLAQMAAGQAFSLQRLLRKPLFVSPAIRVLDLLKELRLKRSHLALVVDEYGGIDGLVTIEDLLEQIVGEIEDEHDHDAEPVLRLLAPGLLEADARVSLETFEAHLGRAVVDEEERSEIDTLGGLVFHLAGRVPGRGELIPGEDGLEYEIVDADPRRIKRLRIRMMTEPGIVSGD